MTGKDKHLLNILHGNLRHGQLLTQRLAIEEKVSSDKGAILTLITIKLAEIECLFDKYYEA